MKGFLLHGGDGLEKADVKFIAEASFCPYKVASNLEQSQNSPHTSGADTGQCCLRFQTPREEQSNAVCGPSRCAEEMELPEKLETPGKIVKVSEQGIADLKMNTLLLKVEGFCSDE